MTKQEQIEEMAVIGCVRNPQAHTVEECSKCGFKQGQCNAYRHAEALYEAGYRREAELDEEECDVVDDYTIGFATYLMQKRRNEADEMKAEIKRLEKENKQLKTECTLLDDELRAARQETIDVLNKLKRQAEHCDQWNCEVIPKEYIDEMIEEQLKK